MVGGVQPAVAAAELRLEVLQFREEVVDFVSCFVDGHLRLQQSSRCEQPLHRAIVPQLVELVVDLSAAERQPHVVAGDGLDRVGLVEDRDVVVGQDAASLATHSEVGKEQRVIDDENVRVPDTSSSFEIVTVVERRTFFAQAVVAVTDDFIPDRAERSKRQVLQTPLGRLRCPISELVELLGFLRIAEQRSRAFEGQLHSPQADVIRAAFDQDCRELDRQDRFQKRDVAREDLFLQRDRVRRDDDSAAFLFLSSALKGTDSGSQSSSSSSCSRRAVGDSSAAFN